MEALMQANLPYTLLAALLISLLAGIVGSLSVVNRIVYLSGGVAHAAFGGIGLALYLGISYLLGATVFALAAALLVGYLRVRDHKHSDIYISTLWAAGMAAGILFVDLTPGADDDLEGYLFGSIEHVTGIELLFTSILLTLTLIWLAWRYREIAAVSYDPVYAKLRGIPVVRCHYMMLAVIALGVVAGVKSVGIVMIIALLSIPVYLASRFANTLWGMMWRSALFALLFTLTGLLLSHLLHLNAGAMIVAVSVVAFAASRLLHNVKVE